MCLRTMFDGPDSKAVSSTSIVSCTRDIQRLMLRALISVVAKKCNRTILLLLAATCPARFRTDIHKSFGIFFAAITTCFHTMFVGPDSKAVSSTTIVSCTKGHAETDGGSQKTQSYDFVVVGRTLSGRSKQIEGMRPDSTLNDLRARLAVEFGISDVPVRLCEGDRIFSAKDLCETLNDLAIQDGTVLTVVAQSVPPQSCIDEFNTNPANGIERLKQHGWEDPKMIAKLFTQRLGFDMITVGSYLSEDAHFNNSVLHEFVDVQEFSGEDVHTSLSTLLSIIRLPCDTQKIDRIMEKFAHKYRSDNPGLFIHDTAFTISFSMVDEKGAVSQVFYDSDEVSYDSDA